MPAEGIDVIESGIGVQVHPKLEEAFGCRQVDLFVRGEGHIFYPKQKFPFTPVLELFQCV